jgi:anti-anti-sigma factor
VREQAGVFAGDPVQPERRLAGARTRRRGSSGRVDAFTAPRFRAAVAGCLDDGAGALVIDLSWVSFLDASGLAVAVYAARRLGARRTAIVCPFPHIARVFRICGLERVLAICESREAALRSYLAD